jgi:N-acyl amino acid synthase of PEP-CTERM/exosortase system
VSDIKDMNSLIAAFEKFFEIVPANTTQLQNQFFHLRYQVYSQEFQLPGFEPWRFPDELEVDKYDQRSIYSLLRHRQSEDIVGGIRLVLCDPADISQPFPIEEHMGYCFDAQLIDPAQLPRRATAEISRVIVTRRFRSRGKEALYTHGMDESSLVENKPDGQRQFPHPVLGLLMALVRMSVEFGITHWYAVMEPAFNRLLGRFSANLRPIGPKADYYGIRQPCLDTVDNMLTRVFQENRDIWELVTDQGKFWSAPQGEHLSGECRGHPVNPASR